MARQDRGKRSARSPNWPKAPQLPTDAEQTTFLFPGCARKGRVIAGFLLIYAIVRIYDVHARRLRSTQTRRKGRERGKEFATKFIKFAHMLVIPNLASVLGLSVCSNGLFERLCCVPHLSQAYKKDLKVVGSMRHVGSKSNPRAALTQHCRASHVLGDKKAGSVLLAVAIPLPGCPLAASLRALQSIKMQTTKERRATWCLRELLSALVTTDFFCMGKSHVCALSTLMVRYCQQKTARGDLSTYVTNQNTSVHFESSLRWIWKHHGHIFFNIKTINKFRNE